MKDNVISTWGFGPTYRNRIKYQIEESYNTGYDSIMKYIILTDNKDDFTGLGKHIRDLIIDVVELNDLRKDDEISLKFEPMPDKYCTDREYAAAIRYQSNVLNLLPSYGLQRYGIKTVANLGFSKFLCMDSDVKLPYDRIVNGTLSEEEFWENYNTPINTLKGGSFENVGFGSVDAMGKLEFIWARSIGESDTRTVLQAVTTISYNFYSKRNELNKFHIIQSLKTVEGGIRYFNFEDTNKTHKFIDTYNELYSFFLENTIFYNINRASNYMLCDIIPLGLVCEIENIPIIHYPGSLYTGRQFFMDRFWGPPYYQHPGCKQEILLPADSLAEFLEINKDIIECMQLHGNWPSYDCQVG